MTLQKRIQRKVGWWASRGKKHIQQVIRGKKSPSLPVFVVGCQRSGTNMLVDVFDYSLDTVTYGESHPKAFDNYRLKPLATQLKLVKNAPAKRVVFKPICDSQNVDLLLQHHENARVIWIYRDYQDVTNSAVKKWGTGQHALIRLAATKDDWDHWLVERMSKERRQLVRDLYREEMSVHSAAALKWYLRNEIYFDLNLSQHRDQVRLVKYEDMTLNPVEEFQAIFEFAGIDFDSNYISDVSQASIGKSAFPEIDSEVQQLCVGLQDRLNQALVKQTVQPVPANA